MPCLRCLSIHAQRSSGACESKELNGIFGRLRGVLEEDIAVHVRVVRGGGPFVGIERGELARLVGRIRDGVVLVPDGGRQRGRDQFGERLVRDHRVSEEQIDALDVGLVMDDQLLAQLGLAQRRARRVGDLDDADVLRVIRHTHPVERLLDLHLVAERMLERLALGVFVGVFRRGLRIAEDEGVERPARVQMGLAVVGFALGVGRGKRGR